VFVGLGRALIKEAKNLRHGFDPCHTHVKALQVKVRNAMLVIGILAAVVTIGLAAPDLDLIFNSFKSRWGVDASAKFVAWKTLVLGLTGASDSERLKKINDFYNKRIQFADSADIWGQPDYWATPNDTLGRGAGNCTSFSLAKYFSLRTVGIASEKLRMIYVRAKLGGESTAVPATAHMVVAFYATPEAEPLILDNLIGDIKPASRRPDLIPIFSFNSDGIYTGISAKGGSPNAGNNRYSHWEDLLVRVKKEGFE
jgi:predicted transglutaminase-like cysteine proteinase